MPDLRAWRRRTRDRIRGPGTLRLLHSETIDALRAIEAKFDVSSWRIDDLAVWPILRNFVAFEMLLSERRTETLRPADSPFAPLRMGLDAADNTAGILKDPRGVVKRPTRADVVFSSQPTNRQLVDGRWYDRHFDPLADMLASRGYSTLHLEYRATRTKYRYPRHRPSLLIEPGVLRQLPKAALALLRTSDIRLEGYGEFLSYLGALHPEIRVPSSRWLRLRTSAIQHIASHFERLLEAIAPRVVMMSCYYSLVGMALCLAARRRHVMTVDVQHGVTAMNPAYEGWTRFPKRGYELLPDRFWCWTDLDAAAVANWPTPGSVHHRPIVGGHPWMARWQRPRTTTTNLQRMVESMRGPSKNILVTLTCSSGFSALLRETVKTAPSDWRWWIRLHPRMDRERAEVIAWCRSNVPARTEVERASELPLPLLLSHADVHVTHNSSVVDEASAMATTSVVIDRHALDVYKSALESGWAAYATTPPTIFSAIREQTTEGRTRTIARTYPSYDAVAQTLFDLLAPPVAAVFEPATEEHHASLL